MLIVTAILLIGHVLQTEKLKIDNVTIMLLLILVFCPLISRVTKIKFLDFEAEIDSEEVRQVKREVEEKVVAERGGDLSVLDTQFISDRITSLSSREPILALAELRIELEKVVSLMHSRIFLQHKSKKVRSLMKMISELSENESLSKNLASSLQKVISICNRAIHGDDIRTNDAISIVETGTRLLEVLRQSRFGEDSEYKIIDKSVIDKHMQAHYRITTLIPYVDAPVEKVKVLDQEGLYDFFEHYTDFAEFVIDIRKIDKISNKQKKLQKNSSGLQRQRSSSKKI